MLLKGMIKAMPLPGMSILICFCRPLLISFHSVPVTKAKRIAFLAASRPKESKTSEAAVPFPKVISVTVTPCSL